MEHSANRSTRKVLMTLILVLSLILIALCSAVIILCLQPEPTVPGTTPGQTTAPHTHLTTLPTLPGQTTLPTIPGQTTLPTIPGQTTRPTAPTTLPPKPTTRPTAPTTQPTAPTTQPTAPTTQPTAPTTQPTAPTEPFDVEAFFAETVFIGDSVTLGMRNYCMNHKDALPGVTFLCAGSYAVRHAIGKVGGNNVISITYQGEKMRPEDALAACGAKRVFIMLGLNDIAFGLDWTMGNWEKLLKNIRQACPDIEIYIQSGTPIQIGGEKGGVNNKNMDAYNVRLEQFCQDNGCFFVNVAEALKDEQGGLKESYCSDDYCHLTNSGVKVWIQYLKDYAAALHG